MEHKLSEDIMDPCALYEVFDTSTQFQNAILRPAQTVNNAVFWITFDWKVYWMTQSGWREIFFEVILAFVVRFGSGVKAVGKYLK